VYSLGKLFPLYLSYSWKVVMFHHGCSLPIGYGRHLVFDLFWKWICCGLNMWIVHVCYIGCGWTSKEVIQIAWTSFIVLFIIDEQQQFRYFPSSIQPLFAIKQHQCNHSSSSNNIPWYRFYCCLLPNTHWMRSKYHSSFDVYLIIANHCH